MITEKQREVLENPFIHGNEVILDAIRAALDALNAHSVPSEFQDDVMLEPFDLELAISGGQMVLVDNFGFEHSVQCAHWNQKISKVAVFVENRHEAAFIFNRHGKGWFITGDATLYMVKTANSLSSAICESN